MQRWQWDQEGRTGYLGYLPRSRLARANSLTMSLEQQQQQQEQSPPAQTPSQPQHVDLLSQMQFELHRLSELFLSTVGELQRDAGPVSISAEELQGDGPSASYDAALRSKGFAGEVMQAFSNMQQLIDKLPAQQGSEEEQHQRISELQLRNQELMKELAKQQQAAEAKLQHAQDVYALFAQHELAMQRLAGR